MAALFISTEVDSPILPGAFASDFELFAQNILPFSKVP